MTVRLPGTWDTGGYRTALNGRERFDPAPSEALPAAPDSPLRELLPRLRGRLQARGGQAVELEASDLQAAVGANA